ncbi:MAG: hypothetical protein JW739_03220 [Opitutales bacterium]|nr:hypothetical protein [Opitutales bacterium]
MNYEAELKRIEKEEARLARRKKTLAAKLEQNAEEDTKLESIFQNSGYKTPKALIKALSLKYGVAAVAGDDLAKTRKRTRITAELRDSIKAEVNAGTSMNAASKKFEISYAVVTKIMKGDYDKL